MFFLDLVFGNFYKNFMSLCCLYEGEGGEAGGDAGGSAGGDAGGGSGGAFDVSALNALEGESFRAIIPEEIRSKPYMKDVNSFEGLTKKLDGAQSLLGKPVIPAAEAPPEEWDAFYAKAGRPKTPDAYDFGEIEGVPKEFVDKASEIGLLKKMLHEAGANPRQAKVFGQGFLKAVYKAESEESAAADAKFNKFMDSTFGQHKQTIIENGKKFLANTLPDTVRPFLNDLDDKGLAVVISTADAIVKKYVSEDGFLGKGAPVPGKAADTEASISAEMRTIMADPAYGDPFKDRTQHAKLTEQMENCRARLKALKFNS